MFPPLCVSRLCDSSVGDYHRTTRLFAGSVCSEDCFHGTFAGPFSAKAVSYQVAETWSFMSFPCESLLRGTPEHVKQLQKSQMSLSLVVLSPGKDCKGLNLDFLKVLL